MTRQRIVILMAAVVLQAVVSKVAYSQTSGEASSATTRALTEYDNAWNRKDIAAVSRILLSEKKRSMTISAADWYL